MKTSDKIILCVFLVFLASYATVLLYTDLTIEQPVSTVNDSEPISQKVDIEKLVETDSDLFFEKMTNLEIYPLMIPGYVSSVDIINKTGNTEFAKVTTSIVKTSFTVKHTVVPYQSHKIEVLDGDAKYSVVEQNFTKQNGQILLKTHADIHLEGFLKLIGFVGGPQYSKIGSSVIDSMIKYSLSS